MNIGSINHFIKQKDQAATAQPKEEEITLKKPSKRSQSAFLVDGVDNLVTTIARCCKPIPGDAVIGYITQSYQVSIHRQDCSNIAALDESRSERLVPVHWHNIQAFTVDIEIEANLVDNLATDISHVIMSHKGRIIGLNRHANKTEQVLYINITLETPSIESLQIIIKNIQAIKSVRHVSRS